MVGAQSARSALSYISLTLWHIIIRFVKLNTCTSSAYPHSSYSLDMLNLCAIKWLKWNLFYSWKFRFIPVELPWRKKLDPYYFDTVKSQITVPGFTGSFDLPGLNFTPGKQAVCVVVRCTSIYCAFRFIRPKSFPPKRPGKLGFYCRSVRTAEERKDLWPAINRHLYWWGDGSSLRSTTKWNSYL